MENGNTSDGHILTKREKRELAKEEKQKESERSNFKSKIKKLSLIIAGFLILGFLGYKGWKWINTPLENNQTQSGILTVRDGDNIKGNPNAEVTLIEYGDFECPACAAYSDLVEKVFSEHTNDLRTVFRHFPLPTHKNAVLAAQATEAAGRQGKFWEMHDILYQKQSDWVDEKSPLDKFKEYAKSLNLDEQKFLADYDSKETKDKINSDQAEGYKLKITSTPTFYLNGKLIDLASGNVDLRQTIESALAN